MTGRIHQINISSGGVPKLPIPEVTISGLGPEGDGHNDKNSHGGPDKAVCLFSLEIIEALREEGHPIFPGATGENITVAGIDWANVVPGTRWELGDEVEIEVTHFTSPCNNQVNWFINQEFSRINQAKHPGWSRVYARVLNEGRIRAGDVVVPATESAEREARSTD